MLAAIVTLALFLLAVDNSPYFPLKDRVSVKEMPAHLLNNPALPGGTLAEYKGGYQLFLVRADSNVKAADLLLDYKKTLKDPKYLAHMGGFFGTGDGRPAYVFAKGPWLAGVVGLAQEKADIVAREFAARLPYK